MFAAAGLLTATAAAILWVARQGILTQVPDRQQAPAPPISVLASEAMGGEIQLQVQDFRMCGTYYLSYPEKCLIDGEYISRFEFPSERASRVSNILLLLLPITGD